MKKDVIYTFKDLTTTGIDKVPIQSLVLIEDDNGEVSVYTKKTNGTLDNNSTMADFKYATEDVRSKAAFLNVTNNFTSPQISSSIMAFSNPDVDTQLCTINFTDSQHLKISALKSNDTFLEISNNGYDNTKGKSGLIEIINPSYIVSFPSSFKNWPVFLPSVVRAYLSYIIWEDTTPNEKVIFSLIYQEE